MATTITVELFTASECTRCAMAEDVLRRVAESAGDNHLEWRVVDVLDEIDYAVALGVLSTPAIAIDGEVVFTSLPSEKKLRQELADRISWQP